MSDSQQNNVPKLGGWASDDLEKTIDHSLTSLPDGFDESSESDKAARMLAKALTERFHNTNGSSDPVGPTALMVTERWRHEGKRLGWMALPQANDGSERLSNRILVGPPNLATSYAAELPNINMGDIYEWIREELNLGQYPTITFNPSATTPTLRIYPLGLNHEDRCEVITIDLSGISYQSLESALYKFWEDIWTGDPKAVSNQIWKNRSNFEVYPSPEKRIQFELQRHLRIKFGRCLIEGEVDTRLGRADVKVTVPINPLDENNTAFRYYSIIELKAITDGNKKPPFNDTQKVLNDIQEGLIQAHSYAKPPTKADHPILSVYDLRPRAGERGKSCIECVEENAKKNKINVYLWPIFAAIGQARKYEWVGKSPLT